MLYPLPSYFYSLVLPFLQILTLWALLQRKHPSPFTVAAAGAAPAFIVPATPAEQTRRAIESIRNILQQQQGDGTTRQRKNNRLYVDYLLPLPEGTNPADVDPWPGGLAQMYPAAETVLKEILQGVVDDAAGPCSSQVVSQSDCCGFLVQESVTSPSNDVAAILFPGADQLDRIADIDQMVGPDRTLILFNRQFTRPADFGFLLGSDNQRCNDVVFDRFAWGFALQEFACRGEDVKLTYEYPAGWRSCVICDEDVDKGREEIALLAAQPDRPLYDDLERRINEVLPEPLWMRKMGEASEKGFKFQRGGPPSDGGGGGLGSS